MAGATLRSQDPPQVADLDGFALSPVCVHTSTYEQPIPLSQTDGPRPTYRVTDRRRDAEPALHPATLPSGAPHPLAGPPVPVVTSPSPDRYRVEGRGRARTWAEVGATPSPSSSGSRRGPPPAPGPSCAMTPTPWTGSPTTWSTRPPAAWRSSSGSRSRRRGTSCRPVSGPPSGPARPQARLRPPSPAATLAGPLRGSRRPRLVGQPRPEVPRKLPVSPSDGLDPQPRYQHLGTGASVRLRPSGSLSPLHPALPSP